MTDIEATCNAWVRFASMTESQHADGIPPEDFHHWEILNDLAQTCPSEAWRMISTIAERLHEPRELAYLAAGPFEEMLIGLGDNLRDFFERHGDVQANRLFPFVWTSCLTPSSKDWIENVRRSADT